MQKIKVYKTNDLISSAFYLTLIEQQIILYAIAHGREDDKLILGREFTFNVADFARNFGYELRDGNVYKQLKAAMVLFSSRETKLIFKQGDGTFEVRFVKWLQKHGYNDGHATISVLFSNDVLEHVTRLQGAINSYTTYCLHDVSQLKSPYSIRLYELLKRFSASGKHVIEVAWLRENFMLGEKYKLTNDVTRFIVKRGESEINAYTDLDVSYIPIKECRQVIGYLFTTRFKPIEKVKKEIDSFPSPQVGESDFDYKSRIRKFQKKNRI